MLEDMNCAIILILNLNVFKISKKKDLQEISNKDKLTHGYIQRAICILFSPQSSMIFRKSFDIFNPTPLSHSFIFSYPSIASVTSTLHIAFRIHHTNNNKTLQDQQTTHKLINNYSLFFPPFLVCLLPLLFIIQR